jgi:hypothetical protein
VDAPAQFKPFKALEQRSLSRHREAALAAVAIQENPILSQAMDCFASLAMTAVSE